MCPAWLRPCDPSPHLGAFLVVPAPACDEKCSQGRPHQAPHEGAASHPWSLKARTRCWWSWFLLEASPGFGYGQQPVAFRGW